MLDEEEIEEFEEILETQLSRLWTKTAIAKCYREGKDKKATIEYLHGLAEFTNEVIDELAVRDGYDKIEVIEK